MPKTIEHDDELRGWSNSTLEWCIRKTLDESQDKQKALEEVRHWLHLLREEADRRKTK